jgi:murein DD-endopeptidase MepM/ murein hydrolase activator NlpD
VVLTLLLLPWASFAQSDQRRALEAEKTRLLDEIELANRILAETKQDKAASLGNIETVQQKIRLREKLIRTLDKEVEFIDLEEEETQERIDTLELEIERQKQAYAQMIRQAYKSRHNSSRLMFILSSEDFNQALRRIEYLKQYAEFRRQQVQEIEEKELTLKEELKELGLQKARKAAVRSQLEREKNRLGDERLSQEQAIAEFKKMERDLKQKLREKQKAAAAVEAQIQKAIAAEIARAKALAKRRELEEEASSLGLAKGREFSQSTSNEELEKLIAKKRSQIAAENPAQLPEKRSEPRYELTPEASALAANFAANQKRLPWPVERGLVVGQFGPQRHPVVKSVMIENRGIDIATEKNSAIRAIFDGVVSSVLPLPDGQLAIIINHGSYFTVYQNLTNLQVQKGQKVSKLQTLGNSYTDPNSAETRFHFELWKDQQAVNPLLWLVSK